MVSEPRDGNVRCWTGTSEFESVCPRLGLGDVVRALL